MKREFLQQAVELSLRSAAEPGAGPFGAVIVADGKVVASGYNTVVRDADPTAHAEVNAIRAAGRALGSFDLSHCELYTSCEPCPMCLGAIYWSRFKHVYFANTRQQAAAIGFDDDFIYRELDLPMDRRSIPCTHVDLPEARTAFDRWAVNTEKQEY